MKENKIAGATKVLLDIMYFVGMVVTLTLPVSFKWYGTVINPFFGEYYICLLYTSPSPRDRQKSRMPSSA